MGVEGASRMGRNVATSEAGGGRGRQGKCAGGALGPCPLPDEQPQATFALSPPQHTITLLIDCVHPESSTLISS